MPEAIGVAKKGAMAAEVQYSTSFKVGISEALQFDDESYDFVFSAGTISCFYLCKAHFELARLVKPDGYVVIVDTLGHNPLLNMSRKTKCKKSLKTQWSFDHVWKLEGLCKCVECFEKKKSFSLT